MVKEFNPLEKGYSVIGRVMDNGETRCGLSMPDGSRYGRTEATTTTEPKWQNSHHHEGLGEVYIPEVGWIAVAIRDGDDFVIRVYYPGKIFYALPGTDHNVFVSPGAVFHVVKYGKPIGNPEKEGNDWFPSDNKFDSWSKSLTIEEIMELAEESL